MLEGLEVSEVDFLLVLDSSDDFRLHSEYFSKNFLTSEDYFQRIQTVELSEIATIADGDHAKFPDNQTADVRYLQARDIKNNFLEISSDVFVSNEYFAKNQRSLISGESILLSIMGTVGDITITPRDFEPCMCNRALAIIKNIKDTSPQFLFAYLTTKHAAENIERLKNGGVQQRINLDSLSKVLIPILSKNFQSKIEGSVILAQNVRGESKQSYIKAEDLLLETLGMANFSPSAEKVNIKSFKDSFAATSRLDAEYYQPRYEQLIRHLESHKNGFFYLHEVAETRRGVFVSEAFYKDSGSLAYVRGADISSNQLIADKLIYVDNYEHKNQEDICIENDIVMSLIGSVGTASLVTKNFSGSLVSNNLGIIRIKHSAINPYVLHLFLTHTKIGGELFGQQEMRTAQPKISDKNIHYFPIPKIDIETQTKIAALVQQSFALKAESEHLLEAAKRAVETAIETNEDAALAWLASIY